MTAQVLVAMAATLAFSVLFGAPRRHWGFCAVVGGVGWLINIAMIGAGADPVLASFVATLSLTFLSRVLAYWRKAPVILFLVAGIFPLVPGAGIYYTAFHLFSNHFDQGISKGVETLKFAGAIALGILSGVSLPAGLFSWPRMVLDAMAERFPKK